MEPVLHVRRVSAQSPSCKDGNVGHREVFASLNDRKVWGQRHVYAQNVVGIARLKLSVWMFSENLMGRGTPVLRRVVLPVWLNVVTHVIIYFRSGTGSFGAKLKQFRKARWVAITNSRFTTLNQNKEITIVYLS